jgi:uncharacterized membrane protein
VAAGGVVHSGVVDERLERLEADLRAIGERLARLEDAVGARVEPAEPRPAAAPALPPKPTLPPLAPPAARPSVEELLGGRVLAWVGGIAVVVGVVFFLVMAASRGWIDEATRTLLALVGSTALLGVSLWLHERQGRTQAALAAASTAIAALYATLVAATSLYELVTPVAGLALALVVGATAAALAVRWEEPVVGGIGIVGALFAPVLVGADTGTTTLLFMTVALCAAVAVLLWQRWSWLRVIVLVVAAPQLAAWLGDENDLALELAVLGAFWLLFTAAALGHELRVPTERLRLSSAALVLANAALLAFGGWLLLDGAGHDTTATAWVIGAAALHVGIAAPAYRGRISDEIGALLVAVGCALAAVGLALALDGPALVAAWAAEAVVVAYAARRLEDDRGFVAAGVFLGLAAAVTLADEAPPEGLRVPVDDFAGAAAAVAAVGLSGAACGYLARDLGRRRELGWEPWHVAAGVAAAAAVYLPSLAIVAGFGTDGVEAEQTPQVLLSAFWSVTGVTLVVVGLVRDARLLRIGGLALLGVAVAKVFVYDLAELDSIYRALSFIALGLLLLGAAFAYQRVRRELRA